jgi:hypothetical protein
MKQSSFSEEGNMIICAKDLLGKNAISMQSGKNLYEKIYEPLKAGQVVEIDFDGIELFATPFFNASIGYLLKDISIDDLKKILIFSNLSNIGKQLLNHVIANAIEFYTQKQNQDVMEILSKNADKGL